MNDSADPRARWVKECIRLLDASDLLDADEIRVSDISRFGYLLGFEPVQWADHDIEPGEGRVSVGRVVLITASRLVVADLLPARGETSTGEYAVEVRRRSDLRRIEWRGTRIDKPGTELGEDDVLDPGWHHRSLMLHYSGMEDPLILPFRAWEKLLPLIECIEGDLTR